MIFGDIAPPAVAERARELVEVALPYTALLATFAFIGAIAVGIVRYVRKQGPARDRRALRLIGQAARSVVMDVPLPPTGAMAV